MTETATAPAPLVVGEVLFDQFEDGSTVLGGAPFNVAWHLHGFGLNPLFVSRIGDDENGRAVLAAMERWGMVKTGLQIDRQRPTGRVQVALESGQPHFTILPDQAYDYIDLDASVLAMGASPPSLIYHGTLATRAPVSRETLTALRARLHAPAFIDLNLRAPWWDHTLVWHALRGARWVKLNEDELRVVRGDEGQRESSVQTMARSVAAKFGFDMLIVTRGSAGAFAVTENEIIETETVQVTELLDTVGAGDAFSAVTIIGLLKRWPIAQTLQRAAQFAAQICANRGATLSDKATYAQLLASWSQPG